MDRGVIVFAQPLDCLLDRVVLDVVLLNDLSLEVVDVTNSHVNETVKLQLLQ